MIWDQIDFILRETGLQLRRERLIAIATISTVAVLLLVLGALALLHLNLQVWTDRMANELELWGYFAKEAPRAEARQAAMRIISWPEVRSGRFVPKEEGLKQLQTYLAGSRKLHGIGNPLPDAVRLQLRDPNLVPAVARRLAETKGIKRVVPSASEATRQGSLASRIVGAKRISIWAGGVISALVAVAGMLIVHNTIRLALHARWREIYVMQLVGATRSLIAAPFLLEGTVHGLLGAALACCLLVPAHMYLHSLSARAAPFLRLLPDRAMLSFGLGLLLAGALLGLTGSIVSIRRFLLRRPEWHT
jgi:cell division protein FtsX